MLLKQFDQGGVIHGCSNGLLVPAAAAPTAAGSIYFELRGTGNFTEGTTSSFQYVDVVAKRISVAA